MRVTFISSWADFDFHNNPSTQLYQNNRGETTKSPTRISMIGEVLDQIYLYILSPVSKNKPQNFNPENFSD